LQLIYNWDDTPVESNFQEKINQSACSAVERLNIEVKWQFRGLVVKKRED